MIFHRFFSRETASLNFTFLHVGEINTDILFSFALNVVSILLHELIHSYHFLAGVQGYFLNILDLLFTILFNQFK